MDKDVTLAKIVATPTNTSWSQAYNAGKLFAVLSLERTKNLEGSPTSESETGVQGEEKPGSEVELASIGKTVLEALEQEFFSLEAKDLESIKKAVEASFAKIPNDLTFSFVVSVLSNDILYAFIKGRGRVDLKRDEKLGTILESKDENGFSSASGVIKDGDLAILQTSQFSEIVSNETLSSSISASPAEVSEALAPLIHQSEKGGAASLILEFKNVNVATPVEPENEKVVDELDQAPASQRVNTIAKLPSFKILNDYFFEAKNVIRQRKFNTLPHSKRVLLTVGVILVIVFAGSIFLAVKSRDDAKTKAAYEKVYVAAERKYEEGQSLIGLNQALARDSFISARETLEQGKAEFKKGSSEEKKVNELLGKIDKILSETSGVISASAIEVDDDESEFLSLRKEPGVLYVATEDNDLYSITSSEISDENEAVIENDNDWGQVGGFGTYLGNLYVLDKGTDQIIKFVATSGGDYGKANYFTNKPELGNAVGIAIDGSIYVLHKTGDLMKFTRGNNDNFQISGLDKAFLNPTRIFTNVDFDNIYVLDNGNSRIVVIDKEGKYVSQYHAGILKTAKDFEVLEESKKIFVLVGSKIFQIDL